MSRFDTIIERRNTGSLKWDLYCGRDILPMWVADMDFAVAPAIAEALSARIAHGVLGYTKPSEELEEVVRDRLRRLYDWEVPASVIVWLPGLVAGLNVFCRAVGTTGNSVVTMTPIYPPFLSAPVFAGRQCIRVEMTAHKDRWGVSPTALRAAITADTRGLLLCNPHNPTGRVFTRAELREIADVCVEHDLIICSDEIHCDLILNDLRHTPVATLSPEIAARTITFMAPSKTFNVPGLNCSFAIIPDEALRRSFRRQCRGVISDVNVFGLNACLAAYRDAGDWLSELLPYLRTNRDLTVRFIRQHLPELAVTDVEATYLAWIDVRNLAVDAPVQFFETHGIGLSDGASFGMPGYVRLNFGCPRAILEEGLQRMKAAVESVRTPAPETFICD